MKKSSKKRASARPTGGRGNAAVRTPRKSATQKAYETIKEMILMGEIAPLQQIDEPILREQLGAGRTPVREALHRLAYDGLVTVVPFRGTITSGIDLSDIDQIMELRVPLEILGSRLAAQRATKGDVDALRERLREYDIPKLLEAGEFVELLRLDQDMHEGITNLADNKFLARELSRLRDLTWRFHVLFYRRRKPTLDNSFNNYDELLDALADGDADAMEAAVGHHFKDYLQGFPK